MRRLRQRRGGFRADRYSKDLPKAIQFLEDRGLDWLLRTAILRKPSGAADLSVPVAPPTSTPGGTARPCGALPSHGRGRRFNPYSAHYLIALQIKVLRFSLASPIRNSQQNAAGTCTLFPGKIRGICSLDVRPVSLSAPRQLSPWKRSRFCSAHVLNSKQGFIGVPPIAPSRGVSTWNGITF
jgi:hypothetical protein